MTCATLSGKVHETHHPTSTKKFGSLALDSHYLFRYYTQCATPLCLWLRKFQLAWS
jgi:hypothetical protein